MSRLKDISNALKPLGPMLYTVMVSSGTIEGITIPETTRYKIILNTDDPDSYKSQIESLLRASGLADVPIVLLGKSAHGQSST
jgi:hypothetical protein